MRRAAWNAATVLHSFLCVLATLAAAQTPQQCADSTMTSVGTENYARMCGVNADAACEATASSIIAAQYPASLGVDGVLSSAGTGGEIAFISQREIGWWRVDFGITRRVQRVHLRNTWTSAHWTHMRNIMIRVGNEVSDSDPLNTQCGSWGTTQLDNYITCDIIGRYLFVTRQIADNMMFTELQAFGPCACPAGKYGPITGSSACVVCPTGKTSSRGAIGSGACYVSCNAGFEESADGSCAACASGKYTFGAGVACAACASGKYTFDASVACADPPANAIAPDAQSFLCNAGYSTPVVSNACSACTAGKYKVVIANQDCLVCTPDSVSLAASTSNASCTCKTDFVKHPATGQCIYYVLHTIASSPTGFAGSRILSCPPGQVSPADSTSLADCVCAPGFSTEKTQDFVCLDAWQHAIQSELLTCLHADGSVKPFVHYDTEDPTEQMPCVQVSRADCEAAAATNAFRFSVYVQFDELTVCFGALEIETVQAVMNEPDCERLDGTAMSQSIFVTLHQPGACEPCAADSYKATAGDAACTPCGAGKRSLPGAETQDHCLCDKGFSGAMCDACLLNTYKTYVGSASCRACPGNTSQALGTLGATSLASCQCNAGYRGPDGGPCVPCDADTYKPAAGPHACTGCQSNSVSPPASTASAQCVCDLGYTSTNNSQCQACLEGTYKNNTGNHACSACPANTVTVSPEFDPNEPAAPPATAPSECICGPGFFGPAGGPCAACEAGFFCTGFLSGGSATQCYDEHASSPAGSADDSDCVCMAGYWFAPSSLCSACPLNRFCPGDDLLYACPSNSTAPARSTNETACTCDSGFVPE